mmetsp:Transcript_32428/g.54225  ORF Transcript_32428/g.54225 Transcript_32428/m.54225 type:complete len:347 (-) Transcript_32428:1008-2048(-)|eukprot:CAMPEP_0174992196 /NCGR_PEP_ID=MMETSP0004_2-20121128/22379_1 /TAXON_ID=420556 /ORGANISM="Ochromonas sp., Strain CCMP1393" /LENGTH=346 /DNA_ID=CAMNT_0016246161 /DNA_START=123 /DNA_END=1163 /DNA_ORIENTATION=-
MSTAKAHDALAETNTEGKFVRTAAGFREVISPDHPVYKPESGRYHLYISLACPWANRCLAVIKLKGLDNCITHTVVHPTWQKSKPDDADDKHHGWAFYQSGPDALPLKNSAGYGSFAIAGCDADPIIGAKFVRDLYEKSNDTNFKYTVPVLWDKQTNTIVSNESSEIIRMFTKEFNAWGSGPYKDYDLYPEALRGEIDAVNDWVYTSINDGVYKCGFAKSQAAYDDAVTELYKALDRVEEILSKSRYLIGNTLTEADIRLFMTLIRFDEVYVVYFKCNVKRIADYPNMRDYLRDIYQLPNFKDCVNIEHIKVHYFTSHATLNPYAVVPKGPDVMADIAIPHTRKDM